MLDVRNIEGGIWDENILTGTGCTHFNWSFGGIQDSYGIDGRMWDFNSK